MVDVVERRPCSSQSSRRLARIRLHVQLLASAPTSAEMPRLSKPRVPLTPKSEWRKDLQDAMPQPSPGNVFQALAVYPDMMAAWLRWATHVVYKSTLLPDFARQRNLALARTGWLTKCEYAYWNYISMGKVQKMPAAVMSDEDVAALPKGPGDAHWSGNELDAASLRAADELHDNACISDQTWAVLAKHMNSQQLVDFVASIGQYHLNAMLINSLGVPLDGKPKVSDFQQTAGRKGGEVSSSAYRPAKARIPAGPKLEDQPLDMNVLRTLALHPKMNERFNAWVLGHIMGKNSKITKREREIAILRIGWLCNSRYEWYQHTRIAAKAAKMTVQDFNAVEAGASSPHWSEKEALIITATDELKLNYCISDETWARLEKHFSLEQRMDIIGAVGHYTLVSFLLNSVGVELEDWNDPYTSTHGRPFSMTK